MASSSDYHKSAHFGSKELKGKEDAIDRLKLGLSHSKEGQEEHGQTDDEEIEEY